jgi:3',5'-cyclic AMP phosphodiesterase CpdA
MRIVILSDVHYASAAEQARGEDYEFRDLSNPLLRLIVRIYRRYYWLRHPLSQNYLLDRFLDQATPLNPDYVIANGDFAVNTAFLGLSDEAAFQSARECLEKLRSRFGEKLRATYGDHELGKLSFFGGRGGMRLESWKRAWEELGMEPFWQLALGSYLLVGVVSSLIALPVYLSEALPDERDEWQRLRAAHMAQIRQAFDSLRPEQRVLLFCHDPTALPFLWREDAVRQKLRQIEQTIIGHLHSNLILRQSWLLAGIPRIGFLGNTARRLSTALREARHWQPFKVRLCPSLAGIELLKDGGFYVAELDLEGRRRTEFSFQPVPR